MTAETVIVLNWLDLICTLIALRRGCVELNPLMACVPVMELLTWMVLLWWWKRELRPVA